MGIIQRCQQRKYNSLLGKPLFLGYGKSKDRPEFNISTKREKGLAKQDLVSTESKASLGYLHAKEYVVLQMNQIFTLISEF